MALQFENHSVPFSGGIDQEDTEKMVPPGRVLKAVNVVQTHSKKFEKRNGSVALIQNNVLAGYSTGALLSDYNQELIEGGTLASGLVAQTSLAAKAQQWVQKGMHQPISVKVGSVLASTFNHSAPDEAATNGVCVYAYEVNDVLYGAIQSQDTGAFVVIDQVLDNGGAAYNARVVALGNSLTVFWQNGNGIYASTVWTGNDPVFSAVRIPVVSGVANFEARACTGTGAPAATQVAGGYIAIAYQGLTLPGVNAIALIGWSPWTQLRVGASTVMTPAPGIVPTNVWLWCLQSSANFLVGYSGGIATPTFKWVGKTITAGAFAVGNGGTLIATGGGNFTFSEISTTAGCTIVYESGASPPVLMAATGIYAATGFNQPTSVLVRSVSLWSDAFLEYGNTPVAVCAYVSVFQPTYFLLNLLTGAVLAKMQPGNGGGARAVIAGQNNVIGSRRLASPSLDLSGNTRVPLLTLTQGSGTYNGVANTISAVTETVLGFAAAQYTDQLGPNLYLTGGFPASYDGNSFEEHMTHLFPEPPTIVAGTVGVIRVTQGVGTGGLPAIPNVSEVTDIYFPPDTLSPDSRTFGSAWQIQPGSWIWLWSQQIAGVAGNAAVCLYFTIDGVGSLPGGMTAIPCQVVLNSTDNAFTVAQKTLAAFATAAFNTGANPYFTANVYQTGGTPTGGSPTYKLTVTTDNAGAATMAPGIASAASTDFRIDGIAVNGSTTQQATQITCPDATHLMPGGYFLMVKDAGMICFYFNVGPIGSIVTIPTNVNTGGFCPQSAVTFVAINVPYATTAVGVAALVAAAVSVVPGGFTQTALTPFIVGTTASGQQGYNVSSAGLLPDGTYLYQYTFSWTDDQGQKQESAPSPTYVVNIQGVNPTWVSNNAQPIDPTGHGNDLMFGEGYGGALIGGSAPLLTMGTLRLTGKQNLQLVVYRTTVSVGNSPVLYRASSPVYPLINSVALDSLQYIETTPDSLLQKNLELYTSGSDGEWPAMAAPAFSFTRVHRGRICGISSENPNQWWPSQPWVPNSGVSPAYNPNILVNVPADGGSLQAFCTMNEKVYFFEQTKIYFSVGDGPGPDVLNAAGTSYSAPDLVTDDCGCSAPGSVLLTPLGIMFQSSKGMYLLDPSGNVSSKIGLQVQDLVKGQTCVSSVLMPDRGEARFAFASGMTLVFNYFFGMWYQFTGWGGPATIWQGTYVFYSPIGQGGAGAGVCQETPGVYTDGDGSLVYSLLDLFWAAWAGPQGYQRVRYATFLGTFGSDHSMVCTVAYNYQTSSGEVTVWNATGACDPSQFGSDAQYGEATPYGDPILGVYQCRLNPGLQLCESIKLTFQDTALPNAGGAGFSLEDLTFNVGLESGTMRLPSGAGGHQAG